MDRTQRPALSDREKQLLDLASQGLIDTAIASRLGISEATVSTYWGRVRVKLGPFSRTELVAMVLREESEKAMASLRAQNKALTDKIRLDTGDYGHASNFYKDLLEAAADAMLVVNSVGVIESINESASNLFGYEKDELVGKPVTTLIPGRFREHHDRHRAEYLNSPEKKRMGEHMATIAEHKSGQEFPIAATLSAVITGSETVVLCIVRSVHVR